MVRILDGCCNCIFDGRAAWAHAFPRVPRVTLLYPLTPYHRSKQLHYSTVSRVEGRLEVTGHGREMSDQRTCLNIQVLDQ